MTTIELMDKRQALKIKSAEMWARVQAGYPNATIRKATILSNKVDALMSQILKSAENEN